MCQQQHQLKQQQPVSPSHYNLCSRCSRILARELPLVWCARARLTARVRLGNRRAWSPTPTVAPIVTSCPLWRCGIGMLCGCAAVRLFGWLRISLGQRHPSVEECKLQLCRWRNKRLTGHVCCHNWLQLPPLPLALPLLLLLLLPVGFHSVSSIVHAMVCNGQLDLSSSSSYVFFIPILIPDFFAIYDRCHSRFLWPDLGDCRWSSFSFLHAIPLSLFDAL